MIFDYYYANPTGNITLLVETPVERGSQPFVASRLMEAEPTAEQVGFIEKNGDDFHLQMAGGEFCGNASMSAACVYCLENGIEKGKISISVSGCDEKISVNAEKKGEIYFADVEMPAADEITGVALPLYENGSITLPVVKKPGVFHLICEKDFSVDEAEKNISRWCSLLGADCLGFMLLKSNSLLPLVYVPGANTLFRESSCASGTTAVGEYLCRKEGRDVEIELEQPGGVLKIKAGQNKNPVLSGKVTLCKKKIIL